MQTMLAIAGQGDKVTSGDGCYFATACSLVQVSFFNVKTRQGGSMGASVTGGCRDAELGLTLGSGAACDGAATPHAGLSRGWS